MCNWLYCFNYFTVYLCVKYVMTFYIVNLAVLCQLYTNKAGKTFKKLKIYHSTTCSFAKGWNLSVDHTSGPTSKFAGNIEDRGTGWIALGERNWQDQWAGPNCSIRMDTLNDKMIKEASVSKYYKIQTIVSFGGRKRVVTGGWCKGFLGWMAKF